MALRLPPAPGVVDMPGVGAGWWLTGGGYSGGGVPALGYKGPSGDFTSVIRGTSLRVVSSVVLRA